MQSGGLYAELSSRKLLIPHDEMPDSMKESDEEYKVIRPELIPFISYPYEWSSSDVQGCCLAYPGNHETITKGDLY